MKHRLIAASTLLIVFCKLSVVQADSVSDLQAQMVASIVQARLAGKPGRVISPHWAGKLPLDIAYTIQQQAVQQWLGTQKPEGFKAGLTSRAGQKKFAFEQPVAGVFLPGSSQVLNNGSYVIRRSDFNRPMFETEIGFQLKERVSTPIKNSEALKTKVAYVLPVIEVPDIAVDQLPLLTGTDLVANNVMAKQFIVGSPQVANTIDLDALVITIKKNGRLLSQGQGSDAMDSQWQALLWLINRTVANGWVIHPNQLLITGALGRMLPATDGEFQVDFDRLGKINFFVKP